MGLDRLLARNYDVAGTSYTYMYYTSPINSPKYLKNGGATVLVQELNSTDDTFAGFGLYDLIETTVDGTTTVQAVTDLTGSPDSLVTDTTADWSVTGGRAFSFRRFNSGTGANSGWFWVGDLQEKTIECYVSTYNVATSLDITIEGRINAGDTLQPATIFTKSFTAAAQNIIVNIDDLTPFSVDQIRFGAKLNGTDSGLNQIYAYFKGTTRYRQ